MTPLAEPEILIELDGLEQRLCDPSSGATFTVRVDAPLKVRRGSSVALLGPSGCGKTTLLTVLGLLRSPTRPTDVESFVLHTHDSDRGWERHDLRVLWSRGRSGQIEALRRRHLGFALQSGELLPALTVRENIAAPLRLNGWSRKATRARVDELLSQFGLDRPAHAGTKQQRTLGDQRVNRLSGGESQRVALARAIAHRPTLLFVDEPTSALNREMARDALTELTRLQCGPDSRGALVMITHDEELAAMFADLIVQMAPRGREAVGEVIQIRENCPSARLLNESMPSDGIAASGAGTSQRLETLVLETATALQPSPSNGEPLQGVLSS